MRRVYIVGLNATDKRPMLPGFEVWTLNDWYQFWPWTPTRVYNVHPHPHRHPDPNRYRGDWIEEYNNAIDAGAQVWTVHEIAGLSKQHRLPMDAIGLRFSGRLTCSISIMIYCAMVEGVGVIELRGLSLSPGEYRWQAYGILVAMTAAREGGIEISWEHEERARREAPKVDWANVKPMPNYFDRKPGE
jgi:hypothetical protein